jgi:RNA polymerase sigma-70 factor (ECF subfamily)
MAAVGAGDTEERIAEARRDPGAHLGALLDRFRDYLTMLSRGSLAPELSAKVDASDAVQEAMLKACERFEQFRGTTEAELAAWLRSILARTLTDLARRYLGAQARDLYRERRLLASLDDSSVALADMIPASATAPSEQARRRELGVIVADALTRVSEDHREVLVLRHIEGLDWSEIADRMGRSRKAVGMLWTRALRAVRPHLEDRA